MNAVAQVVRPWCHSRIGGRERRPWVLGIQGPQGCGKSTAAEALVASLRDDGFRTVTVSIDDFYLTYDEQRRLAKDHPQNPYLRYRGYPGTHDIALGVRTLDALADVTANEVSVPVYDKSAHSGRGDRKPESQWRRLTGPFDAVIVEGWMLGFTPVEDAVLEASLRPSNRWLAEYATWTDRFHAMIVLHVDPLETIVPWRVDAERARRNRGEPSLTDEEAHDYIRRFLPAYEIYGPRLIARPPCTDVLTLRLDADRQPIR